MTLSTIFADFYLYQMLLAFYVSSFWCMEYGDHEQCSSSKVQWKIINQSKHGPLPIYEVGSGAMEVWASSADGSHSVFFVIIGKTENSGDNFVSNYGLKNGVVFAGKVFLSTI